jgi:hypothetical protein
MAAGACELYARRKKEEGEGKGKEVGEGNKEKGRRMKEKT